jgi:hypothetical protein
VASNGLWDSLSNLDLAEDITYPVGLPTDIVTLVVIVVTYSSIMRNEKQILKHRYEGRKETHRANLYKTGDTQTNRDENQNDDDDEEEEEEEEDEHCVV